MSPLDLVLSLLDRPRPSGPNQWSARCPAHDDRSPSLSISLGDDGRVLLHCHAECAVDAICAALGLGIGDLFPKGPTLPRGPASSAKRRTFFSSVQEAVRVATSCVQRERGTDWALTQSYSYEDIAGREVLRVLRFEPVGGGDKTCRPVSAADSGWHIGDPEGPLPSLPRSMLPMSPLDRGTLRRALRRGQ